MLKKTICFLLISSLLFAFLAIPVSAVEIYEWGSKETEKKLVELWNGTDEKAALEYYDYEFTADGSISPHLFAPEIGEAFRNEENKLVALSLEFDREKMLQSEYKDFEYEMYLKLEKEDPGSFGKFYFTLVAWDGTTYNTEFKNANDRQLYSFQEIIRECGIGDPSEIGLARYQSVCWFGDYTIDFMDYTPGWNKIGDNYFYIKRDGSFLTSSAKIGGVRYKFGEDGVCQGVYTGFTKSDKGLRYWKNGKLVKNRLFKASNGKYYGADSEGYLTAV